VPDGATVMGVTLFSRRLPHVVNRADLVRIVTPTYAKAMGLEDDEAEERLTRAVAVPEVQAALYEALSEGLRTAQGPRTTDDALVDRLSAHLLARRSRVRPAPVTPGISALLVEINLAIGLAPEGMRATLASERGREVRAAGLRELGAHLVKELLKK
jgi:hypothetical protein